MPEPAPKFILASASPRRRNMLRTLGMSFICASAEVDERALDNESPAEQVMRLAIRKAETIAKTATLPVLAADTLIELDERAIGKPDSRRHAAEILTSLSGRQHAVLTAVSLCLQGRCHNLLQRSVVSFRELHDAEIERYIATGEADDKAGAYAIQGQAAAFILEIHGSYSSIVGLPLAQTVELLRSHNLASS